MEILDEETTVATKTKLNSDYVPGMPFPLNSGNIKILTNSVAVSRETSALNTSVLLMPVEKVERIEVVRGPGSSVYGNFAFMGLVNIITKKGDRGVFASAANGDHYASGAQFSGGNKDFHFDINVAGWTSDQGEGPIGSDANEDRLTAIGSLDYRNTSLSLQLFDRDYAGERSSEERNQSLDIRHHAALSNNWYADFNASYLDTDSGSLDRTFKGDLR